VRAIGASQFTAARFKESLETSKKNGVPRYEALQPHYNLYERATVENEFVPVCVAETIGITPYYGLAAGFLTGKYRSEKDFGQSPRGRSMGKYLNERGLKILAALDSVAGKHKANQAQVAIAWLIARPGVTSPIASATKLAHIADLAAAASLRLDAEDMKRLNDASA
jgi:aryl-alcohol dehydrogenase-like predicted oxidoreductase